MVMATAAGFNQRAHYQDYAASIAKLRYLSPCIGLLGLPWWCSSKESACQCRGHRSDPWVGKIPWRKKWQSTPVFLPGEPHGQRSLAGCSPQDHKRVVYNWVAEQQQYWFTRAAMTRYHRLGGLNLRNVCLHPSEGQESQTRCRQSWFS